MVNYLFLVIFFLSLAINLISIIKYFKFENNKLGISNIFIFIITVTITFTTFFHRNALKEDELTSILTGIKSGNILSIITLIIVILTFIISIYNYIKVRSFSNKKEVEN